MQREVAKVHVGRLEQRRPSIRSKPVSVRPSTIPHASCDAMKRAGCAGRPPCASRAAGFSGATATGTAMATSPAAAAPLTSKATRPAQWRATRNYKPASRPIAHDVATIAAMASDSCISRAAVACRRTTIEQGTDRQQEGESELHQDDGRSPRCQERRAAVELRRRRRTPPSAARRQVRPR